MGRIRSEQEERKKQSRQYSWVWEKVECTCASFVGDEREAYREVKKIVTDQEAA